MQKISNDDYSLLCPFHGAELDDETLAYGEKVRLQWSRGEKALLLEVGNSTCVVDQNNGHQVYVMLTLAAQYEILGGDLGELLASTSA